MTNRTDHDDALERQYVPAFWPGVAVEETVKRWNALGSAFREASKVKADIAYGDSDLQKLDLYLPKRDGAPVLVFIHGGYWRNPLVNRVSCSFCFEPAVSEGALVAMVDYDLCPKVTLDGIVAQLRRVCSWLWAHAREFGGDPAKLHIAGHSAGGHLAAMMAATRWREMAEELPADLVKSILSVSGLFDLTPLRRTSLNADLHLDAQMAVRNSPQHLEPATPLPVSLFVGARESEEFHRQSRSLADAWRNLGCETDFQAISGKDHFTIMESLAEPESQLARAVLRHLGL
jgi:arylformamidase